MDRLKAALESLDEAISTLEDRIGLDHGQRRDTVKKYADDLKTSRTREATVLGAAQKIASRLDRAIEHVETILRH